MSDSIKISMCGGPCSGKTTLAAQINAYLKLNGRNSVFIEEYAVEFISKYGVPNQLEHQLTIFNKQRSKELMFEGKRDFIISDSASWTSYVYGRKYVKMPLDKKDIASLTYLYEEVQKTLNFWNHIFFVPVMDDYKNDNVRYNSKEESIKLSNQLKTWLEIENIPFIDLSDVKLEDRFNFVIKHILI